MLIEIILENYITLKNFVVLMLQVADRIYPPTPCLDKVKSLIIFALSGCNSKRRSVTPILEP